MRTVSEITRFAGRMPPRLVRELARIEVGRGREDLHRTQAPQVMARLALAPAPVAGPLRMRHVLRFHRLVRGRADAARGEGLTHEDAAALGLAELLARYERAVDDGVVHPLVLVAALTLDLASVHPFGDGDGRVVRLVTARELVRHGYGIARYVSLEERMRDARAGYDRALRESQVGWHEGHHDLWPWAGYLLALLADAYDDLDARVVASRTLRGVTKEERVRDYVLHHAPARFGFAQVAAALPDISAPTIRNALNRLRAEGRLSVGRGRAARWTRHPEVDQGHRSRAISIVPV